MMDNRSSFNYQDRNLSEVFRELQEIKNNPILQASYRKKSRKKINFKSIFPSNIKIAKLHSHYSIISFIIVFLFVVLFCNKKIFAKSNTPKYELNNNAFNIQKIVSANANINTFKEQTITEFNIVYSKIYNNNSTLPKGEEIVTKPGVFGKKKISSVKTWENGSLVNEVVLSEETLSLPSSEYIDVGTSEFLAKYSVHIGDTMYVTQNINLKKDADAKSEDLVEIKENLDVKLIGLINEDWCKVSFDNVEGYLKTENLTSSTFSPDIVEKSRITRILLGVNIDMELNKSSNLTKEDFQKILSDLSKDTNNIFKDNYETFYNMDKKYNINGVFLASIAIHESNWGTSTIANDKKNLFGYGAYDRSPYESSFTFSDYSDGIETVAKALAKYYLNTAGTKISDDETAVGSYYNEPTVKGVNTRYASDKEWYSKVYSYMELLYGKL